jgi:N utilization substance protein B
VSSPRRRAREAALQILYFWEVGKAEPVTALDSFFSEHQPEASDAVREYATRLVLGVVDDVAELDRVIEEHSQHWRIERLAVVDRLAMRLAIWELRHEPDLAPAVVINEALELTRRFSSEEAVRFVNGVLDAASATLARGSRALAPEPSAD